MLLVLRDAQQHLRAAIDYYLVDQDGRIVFDGSGTIVWVEQLEISAGEHGWSCIKLCIEHIARAVPHAMGAYWVRKMKTGTKIHYFSRRRLLQVAQMSEEVRL